MRQSAFELEGMVMSPAQDTSENHRGVEELCRYEGSRLRFRGPVCSLHDPYIAVLGGSETFGKGVAQPFPALLAQQVDCPVANLGVMHAGVSLFSEESWLIETASKARLTVLQVLGAQNMSNRMYSVHSRRNDRFVGASAALRTLYPNVDFTDFNFTGHLMRSLSSQEGDAFDSLVEELRWAWVQRMRRLVTLIDSDVVLLWMSDRPPEDVDQWTRLEPAFVDRSMLNEMRPHVVDIVEVVCTERRAMNPSARTTHFPGPRHHADVAEALASAIRQWETGEGLRKRKALA